MTVSAGPGQTSPMSDLAHVRSASVCPPGAQLPGGGRHTCRAGSRHAPPRRRGGPPPPEPPSAPPARAPPHRQRAGAAPAAIHGRLIAALGGEVTPERLLALPD